LPGEPVAPTILSGAQANRNSVTPSASSGEKSRFSMFQMPSDVGVTIYNELFISSIDMEHVLCPSEVLNNYLVSQSRITLVPTTNT
jgi:hypothetical protein